MLQSQLAKILDLKREWPQPISMTLSNSVAIFVPQPIKTGFNSVYLGWIPRIFRSFFCAKIFYFEPIHMKAHTKKYRKMLKFFRKFENIHDFFDFFGVFHKKLFCTVSYSDVLCIIRFSMKFCVEVILSSRCATLCKIVIYQKLSKIEILRGLKLRGFTQN